MLQRLLYTAIFILATYGLMASHFSGGFIEYDCLGDGEYEVTLNLLQDCQDDLVEDFYTVRVIPGCNFNFFTAQLDSLDMRDISQVCDSEVPFSLCQNGNQGGYRWVRYRGIISIADECPDVKLMFKQNFRTAADNLDDDFYSIYLESIIFPQTHCTSTPTIRNPWIQHVCSGVGSAMNMDVQSAPGDSLSYQMAPPLYSPAGNSSAPIPFVGGASTEEPIPGFMLDAETGQMNFISEVQGDFSYALRVESFDEFGALQSLMHMDLRFLVNACGVSGMSAGEDRLLNPGPGTDITGPREIELCQQEQFCAEWVMAKNWNDEDFRVEHNMDDHLDEVSTEFTLLGDSIYMRFCGRSRSIGERFQLYFTMRDDQCVNYGRVQASCFVNVSDLIAPQVFIENFGDALVYNTPSPEEDYSWYENGVVVEGVTGPSIPDSLTQPLSSYQMLVEAPDGCSNVSNIIDTPVNVEEITLGADWQLAPNPASTRVSISGTGIERIRLWELSDLSGRKVEAPNFNQLVLDVANLDEGLYLLRGLDAKGNYSRSLRLVVGR